MAIATTRSRVKERCAVSDSSFDTAIDNVIADYTPVIEFAIRAEYVADVSNTGLQATLNLGAMEICSGEFIAQRCREPGYADEIHLDGFKLIPFLNRSARDPSGLITSGWARLKPYLKAGMEIGPFAGVLSAFKEVPE